MNSTNKAFSCVRNKTKCEIVYLSLNLIICLIIILLYITEYVMNDKYVIEYLPMKNIISKNQQKEIDRLNEDPELNPKIKFTFEIYDDEFNVLSNNFRLKDSLTNEIINRSSIIERRVSDKNFSIIIEYYCSDVYNCEIRNEDLPKTHYYFKLGYQGYNIDHQGDIPLKTQESIDTYELYPFIGQYSLTNLNWEVIK